MLILASLALACPAASRISEPDYNERGLAALRDGRIEEAHQLFQQSVEGDPELSSGWLNLARTTYLLNKETEPQDECVKEGNWKFQVLALLSRAVEKDPGPVLAELDGGTKEFAFKESDHYMKWRLAVTVSWSTDAIRALMRDREWWPTINTFPASWISFEDDGDLVRNTFEDSEVLGTWRAAGGYVEVQPAGAGTVRLTPRRRKDYFQDGNAWYFALGLEPEPAGAILPWNMPVVLGPRVGDCGDYNF